MISKELPRSAHVENLCDGVLFNEITGMNSRPVTSVKKASVKDVYLLMYQNFQSFYKKVLHKLSFLIKFRVVCYRAVALLRRYSIIDFFSQKKTFFIFLGR